MGFQTRPMCIESTHVFRKFANDQDGQFSIMFALLAFPLMASVGIAVDYSQLSTQRSDLQNANDAAALYAAKFHLENEYLPTPQATRDYIQTNFELTVSLPQLSINDTEVTVQTDAFVKTNFMQALGIASNKLDIISKADLSFTAILEFALVVDVTGSMGQGDKMSGLKQASKDFIKVLWKEKNKGADISGSIVPFSQYVNVGKKYINESWINLVGNTDQYAWEGCVGSRPSSSNLIDGGNTPFPGIVNPQNDAGWDTNYCPPTELQEITGDQGQLVSTIAQLTPYGNTYIADGIMWGARTLSPEPPFTGAKGWKYKGKDVMKTIVVMTDGDNTRGPNPAGVYHDEGSSYADKQTQEACNYVKNEGYVVYTVTFGNGIRNSTKELMQGCASSPDQYYDASSSGALVKAFEDIAKSLLQLRLSL